MNYQVIILQPEIPSYRLDFFQQLDARLGGRLRIYASAGSLGALTQNLPAAPWLQPLGHTLKYREMLYWQRGASGIAMTRGDVVVLSGAPRYLSNWCVFLKAKVRGARVVWWGHYRSSTSSGLGVRLRRRLMSWADHVLFYTDREVEQFFQEGGRLAQHQVSALNNGLALQHIDSKRQPYEPTQRGAQLLFVGRLTRKAHFDLLLSALANPALAQARLHVVGDGPERAALQAMAHSLQIDRQLVWHGALTDETRIAAVANQCSLFVYPGSVGLSLIHGMAYGLPAVVHGLASRHMPEFAAFEAQRTGCTFTPGDADSLAQTLQAALTDPVRLASWSAHALARVSQTFNTLDMAARFERMLVTLDEIHIE